MWFREFLPFPEKLPVAGNFLHVWCKFTWLGPKLNRFKICWCIWTILEKVAGAWKCTTEIIFICCFDYCYLVQPKPSTLPWWIQGFSILALIWIWDKQWMQWPNVVYFLSVFVFSIRLCVCICLTFALICIGVTACNMAQHCGEWLFATSKNFKGCWLLDALNIMWKTSLLRTLIVRTQTVLAVSKLSALVSHYTTRCI